MARARIQFCAISVFGKKEPFLPYQTEKARNAWIDDEPMKLRAF
ncbi:MULTISPECIES: hypothetical protein [Bacteroides]|nr:hypothetical protein [Bacteroides heparinolyticus]